MRTTARHRAPITAKTRLTGVFGDPVEHSLSPAMHNAAYAALAMDRRYVAFHVKPPELRAALRGIAAMGILGVNLTVPHKEQALRAMDEISAEGKLLGAINCVINRDGKLIGDNTDARGLERDLRTLKVDVARRTALIIGAGGAAASAALAMRRLKAARVIVANRTRARATRLARRFSTSATRVEASGLDALVDATLLADVSLVINATSMGLTTSGFCRLDYKATPNDCFFYDMLYARKPTAFLAGAIHTKRKHADGAGMLAEQGELAFKLFNGVAPPKGIMRGTLMRALGR